MNDAISLIGAKYRLTRDVMGNPAGSIAFVVDQYQDFEKPDEIGVQLIMKNGATDGFSVNDQNLMLDWIGYEEKYTSYKFSNVLQLKKDWRSNYWDFAT